MSMLASGPGWELIWQSSSSIPTPPAWPRLPGTSFPAQLLCAVGRANSAFTSVRCEGSAFSPSSTPHSCHLGLRQGLGAGLGIKHFRTSDSHGNRTCCRVLRLVLASRAALGKHMGLWTRLCSLSSPHLGRILQHMPCHTCSRAMPRQWELVPHTLAWGGGGRRQEVCWDSKALGGQHSRPWSLPSPPAPCTWAPGFCSGRTRVRRTLSRRLCPLR